jgi:hypothetical protein
MRDGSQCYSIRPVGNFYRSIHRAGIVAVNVQRVKGSFASTKRVRNRSKGYNAGYSLAYSAFALFRIGTSGSASLQSARNAS